MGKIKFNPLTAIGLVLAGATFLVARETQRRETEELVQEAVKTAIDERDSRNLTQ